MKIKILIISFLIKSISFGQAGALDTSFNNFGFKLISTYETNGNTFSNVKSILQPDGKILLAGISFDNNVSNYCVLRLNQDGGNDATFGINGYFYLVGNSPNTLCDLAIQSDGKIVLVNSYVPVATSQNYMMAIRINTNGSIDNSFGTNGYKIIDTIIGTATTVKIQNDGKILIGGTTVEINNNNFGVYRLMPNGSIDTSFGFNGLTAKINGNIGLGSVIYAMDILPDGKIICSGGFYEINNTFDNFCTVKYNSNGTIDTTFGNNGMVLTAVDTGGDVINTQIIQPDGKILLSGYASDGVHYYLPLMRLNPNGSIDTTFGINGLVSQDITDAPYPTCQSIVLQPDGKIVAVGNSAKSFISRFNSDGSLDTTFNNTGYNVCDFNPDQNNDVGKFDSVFFLQNGKILATGQTYYDNGFLGLIYTTVARFESGINLSNELFNKNNITVYPNPTNNKSFFDNSQSKFNNLEISNYLGQLVGTQKLTLNINEAIDLSSFETGFYIVKMSNENKSVSVKVIKE